jgi:hypothetical protein
MEPFYVGLCDLGWGVFAARDLAPWEEILRFEGPPISLADTLAMGEYQANPLQVDFDLYLDIQPPGVLVNHSCDPNAGIVHDTVLVALRPIPRGEEIRFDYSTTMWEDCWTMECRCGSPHCRGVVRDFITLPAELQAEYLGLGIVQGFIVRRLREEAARSAGQELPAGGREGP